jgi:hypothetical protein
MKFILYAAIVLGCTCAISLGASTNTVIYDNGPRAYYGHELSSFQVAEDFVLDTTMPIGGVRFWSLEGYGIRPNALPFDGHIDYWIYSEAGGKPAALLESGVATNLTRIDQGIEDHGYEPLHNFENAFHFERSFEAIGGQRYFLALHMLDHYVTSDPLEYGEFYWASAEPPEVGFASHNRQQGVGPWTDNSQGPAGPGGAGHLAFQLLDGVPEPNGGMLGASACLLAIVVRHRTRTRQCSAGDE